MFYVGEIILVGFTYPPFGWAFCNGQLLQISEYETLFNLIGTTYGGDGQTTFALPDLRGRAPIHQGTGPGGINYIIGETAGSEAVTLSSTQMPTHTHTIDTSAMTITARCWNGAPNQSSPQNAVPAIAASASAFSDASLTADAVGVKRVHIEELRSQINTLRGRYGFGAYPYTDANLVAGTTLMKAQHILDLRTALAPVFTQVGSPPPTYTDTNLAAGTPIRVAHIAELRNAVAALGGSNATPYSNSAPDSNMNAAAIALGGTPTAASAGGSQPHSNMQPYLVMNYCICLEGVFPSQS